MRVDIVLCSLKQCREVRYTVVDLPDSLGRSLGRSEKALAIVLKLFKLGFPRLPYGPILSQELRKLFTLFLLWVRNEVKGLPTQLRRKIPTRFRGSSPPYTSENISFSSCRFKPSAFLKARITSFFSDSFSSSSSESDHHPRFLRKSLYRAIGLSMRLRSSTSCRAR